jgi:hypothetical protein
VIKEYTEKEGELHRRGRCPAVGAIMRQEEVAFMKALGNI